LHQSTNKCFHYELFVGNLISVIFCFISVELDPADEKLLEEDLAPQADKKRLVK
jgi:hypothetical protein